MKLRLIANRSRQQQTIARQSEKSSSEMGGRIVQELNHPRDNTSAATIPSNMTQLSTGPHEIPFISAIRLANTTIFGCLFVLILFQLGDFNHHFNVLNCEFELEKSGLSNEYDRDCDALTSPTIDTLFNFGLRGVGLAEFNNLGCDSSAVLTASTIATIVTNENENENEMIFNSGRLWDTQTETIHQRLNSNDKMGPTAVGSREFNNIACVFDGGLRENEFYYDVNNIFDDCYDCDCQAVTTSDAWSVITKQATLHRANIKNIINRHRYDSGITTYFSSNCISRQDTRL